MIQQDENVEEQLKSLNVKTPANIFLLEKKQILDKQPLEKILKKIRLQKPKQEDNEEEEEVEVGKKRRKLKKVEERQNFKQEQLQQQKKLIDQLAFKLKQIIRESLGKIKHFEGISENKQEYFNQEKKNQNENFVFRQLKRKKIEKLKKEIEDISLDLINLNDLIKKLKKEISKLTKKQFEISNDSQIKCLNSDDLTNLELFINISKNYKSIIQELNEKIEELKQKIESLKEKYKKIKKENKEIKDLYKEIKDDNAKTRKASFIQKI